MKISADGIVIKETDLNDSDKILKIFTAQKGIISAIAKKSKSLKNTGKSGLQLFSYGKFALYAGKSGYTVDDFECKELFFKLRNNLKSLSLAQYFCQLCLVLSPEESISGEFLKFFLNCLFFLSSEFMDERIVKSIFEFRSCALCGYAPKLVGCAVCGIYECEKMYFVIPEGKIFCEKCVSDINSAIFLSPTLLYALRHFVYASYEKLFKISLSEKFIKLTGYISESYVKSHLCGTFKALEFYNKLL